MANELRARASGHWAVVRGHMCLFKLAPGPRAMYRGPGMGAGDDELRPEHPLAGYMSWSTLGN